MTSDGMRPVVAEFVGSTFLAAAVVGSGIMAQRLSQGNVAIALLVNAVATGGILVALIAALGPISGGHFNPAVSLAVAWRDGIAWAAAARYCVAQFVGCALGAVVANVLFGLAPVSLSRNARGGALMGVSEFVATFGLLAVIWGCVRARSNLAPAAVAGYIVAAYWFTPSTSFANPAITVARALSDTFAGIRPLDVPGFVGAQLAGAATATALFAWLLRPSAARARDAIAPHDR